MDYHFANSQHFGSKSLQTKTQLKQQFELFRCFINEVQIGFIGSFDMCHIYKHALNPFLMELFYFKILYW